MLSKLFLNHPRAVGETYAQHFVFAARFAAKLLAASFAAAVHAVVPRFFEKTASRMIQEMCDELKSR